MAAGLMDMFATGVVYDTSTLNESFTIGELNDIPYVEAILSVAVAF